MPKFTLEIDMNNAAFEDAPYDTISTIFNTIRTNVYNAFATGSKIGDGSVTDLNGNTIGQWAIIPDEPAAVPVTEPDELDEFTTAYIEAALFSTNDESDESGGVPLAGAYDASNLAPEALAKMREDCRLFQLGAAWQEALSTPSCWRGFENAEQQAGYDFWLTRNGHGAGFWDGDWQEPHAEALTSAAQGFGRCDLYIGDDGQIYIA